MVDGILLLSNILEMGLFLWLSEIIVGVCVVVGVCCVVLLFIFNLRKPSF